MHQAAPSSDENVAGVTASADEAVEGRKFIRKITSLIIVAGAVLITLYVWGIIERHPRTDDATARANVVGIAPRVAGQILKLNVQDNQAVKEGDVLFEIDPEDYRLILEKAKAELATLDQQLAQAHDTLHRLEPLLPHGFTTADPVDKARTAVTTLQAQLDGEIDWPPSGVPYVKRELHWVRVAQRFPVRIEVENPDPDLFRMGASAVAIIKGPPRK